MPLISVITPAYNSESTISDTINSVLAQTHGDFEYLIVNDSSTDDTEKIIRSFKDERIILINNRKNMGPLLSRDCAQAKAKGEFIAFIDADDLWHPEKLKTQLSYMIEKGISFTYTNYNLFGTSTSKEMPITSPKTYTLSTLLSNGGIALSSYMYRRKPPEFTHFGDHKPFTEHFFLLGILAKYSIGYRLDDILLNYRVHNSMSSDKIYVIRYVYDIFRKKHKFSVFISTIIVATIIANSVVRMIRKSVVKFSRER